jgi:cell wall-associated NlpC family hydrolase
LWEERGDALRTPAAVFVSGFRRSKASKPAILGACVALAAGLTAATAATAAHAASHPTISQVQTKVNQLSAQFDKAVQQYDQVAVQLASAKQQLTRIDKEVTVDQQNFKVAHAAVAAIAAATYENSGSTSLAGLLTSNNPTAVLGEASMMLEIAGSRNEETLSYLAAARQLSQVQQEQQRTESGIQALLDQREKTKNSIGALLSQQKATLDALTTQQQKQIQQSGGGGSGGHQHDPFPTNSQAEKAVYFVYQQLGCQYTYGATGPCSVGFDCSGLVMAAWRYAGITIPRDTYEQWAALPHISSSQLQIGDLLYYNGIGHVAMYVGNGYIIDAPHTGATVEKIPMSESWYASTFDGAARP